MTENMSEAELAAYYNRTQDASDFEGGEEVAMFHRIQKYIIAELRSISRYSAGVFVFESLRYVSEHGFINSAEFGGGTSDLVGGFLFGVSVMTFDPLVSDNVRLGGAVESGQQVEVSSAFEFALHCSNDVLRI